MTATKGGRASSDGLVLTPALKAAVWDEALHVVRGVLRERGLREVVTRTLVDSQAIEPWIEPVSWRAGAESGWIRTSPEIALKRAICAGAGSVFEVAAVARAGERGAHHLPEFHLLEWYRVGGTLEEVRQDVEVIVTRLGLSLRHVFEREAPALVDALPDPVLAPFEVLDFAEAFAMTAGVTLPPQAWANPTRTTELDRSVAASTETSVVETVKLVESVKLAESVKLVESVQLVEACLQDFRGRAGLDASALDTGPRESATDEDAPLRLLQAWTELFSLWSDLAWDPWLAREAAGHSARRGVHLVGFPPALAALSSVTDSPHGARAERFESYVDAREIANGYGELREPREQRARFELVARLRAVAGLPSLTPPSAFLADLEEPGLPPCVGVALGLERVITLSLGLTGVHELSFS